ncbi:alpha-L-rhamnosidase-related protein [Dysgonomonas macrotermitis]|uniref:Alpha-L-rhamnosidase n=1 Tax=Dysgonomonas macrotermitis TaxID=1346286 RepID=A0A1M4X791_9BACT|nr:family 78 glycoside hydrolase catalytic domain [Dysgonomonas macrotermitis]SHE89346.1 alpha-L-rhamnosidase [Dysgonomonas macrotermitis]
MRPKTIVFCIYFLLMGLSLQSQSIQYDPLLDPNVVIAEKTQKARKGEYIWYPGQLSAHLQQKRIKESAERCVNVGYPGKFYEPVNKTWFRKEINLPLEAIIQWESTGKVRASIKQKELTGNTNSIKLPKGKSILLLEVIAENNLPSVKVSVNGQITSDGWQASLDSINWNLAESSPVFGTSGRRPMEEPKTDVVIKPASILPIRNASVNDGNIIIHKNGFVLIDFFHLEVGKVTFTAKGRGTVSVYVGESPEETLCEDTKLFEQKPIEPFVLTGNRQQIMLPERAIRYVKISSDEECEVSAVSFVAKMWPVEFQMTFECDDERINNIWKASVATLHTSTHGFYLDGIKRDYLPWSMDAVLSTFGGDYIFADKQVSLNSLSVALMPLNPTKDDMGIPDYPLHALIGFNQYYKRYGDFNTILSYRDRIEQLLQFYETLQDERGFISASVGGVSWGFVPGWATRRRPDRKGTPTYAQIMLYYNYKIGADFCEKWGDKKLAKHYRAKAISLKDSIFKHFWDERQGVFINGYTKNGELDKIISHHAQYWAILADIFPEDKYENLFAMFAMLPTIPYYKDYVSFEKGYEFIAYSKARKVEQMWNFLLDVFGDWLDQGHTRFPENFSYRKSKNEQLVFYSRPYGLSLCHGANGVPGIVAVLNGIAGFSQSDKDFNHYTIHPDLMNLRWANIEFPVKEGKIKLKLTKDGTNQIEIPAGYKVDFIIKDGIKATFTKAGTYNL